MVVTTHGVEVRGPWSLPTSRRFWEGFAPSALPVRDEDDAMRAVFLVEAGWTRAATTVRQDGAEARIEVAGDGDLDAAVEQVARFLSLDVDATAWPDVGRRDAVVGEAQAALPGLRPCGFCSPYEAAVWTVLSQRIRIVQAARLRDDLVERHGDRGALPAPAVLRDLHLDLPGRKSEYLRAVADAALQGVLDGAVLRAMDPAEAIARVQQVRGLGPFAAELVVLRGANAPDAAPTAERRLAAEVEERYGAGTTVARAAEGWRPFRTWAAVHLRALREERTHEIGGPAAGPSTERPGRAGAAGR